MPFAPANSSHSSTIRFSTWSRSDRKRLLDLVCVIPLLVISLPIMAVIAVLIRATTTGPALFRQRRCGKNGRCFDLLKFRSMHFLPNATGPGVTSANDSRVTPLGRVLRKWKLDELPQLFNVLRGDMSMVGPRPERPEFLTQVTSEQQCILHLTPGLTSSTTLVFRNEEQMLAEIPERELESVYCAAILPQKIHLELAYASTATLGTDVMVLLRTAAAVFMPGKCAGTSSSAEPARSPK